jgi:hypothetical protein
MILLIKYYLNEIFFILISFIPIVISRCLYFENPIDSNNYCQLHKAENQSQRSYKECLRCYIKFQSIKIINQTLSNECQTNLQCIEFEFYNNTLFENFFSNYFYLLKDLFKISNNSQIANALYIYIKHDNIKELNLGYIQSIIKSNGIDYSYLFFTLVDYREDILLDLETDLLNIPLIAIQIQINCDVRRYDKPQIHSNNCVIIQSNNTKTTSIKSSIITPNSPINLFLFIGGLIVFTIWILCLCLCLYIRYYTWKNNDNLNQRSSIVSSMFSVDSFDSRNDDVLFNQYQSSKQSTQFGLYLFDNEF